jgi:hypothetical protein
MDGRVKVRCAPNAFDMDIETEWMDGRVKVRCATNAFDMGINKPGNYEYFEMMMIKNSASFEIFV